jgi:hypothetical protein
MRTRSGRWATSSASLAAAGLVVLATCVVASAGDAGARSFSTSITGSCTLPQGGSAPLTASVMADYPASAPVGKPVPAAGIAVSVTLSPQLTAGLRAAGGTDVGAGVDAQLVATNGTSSQQVPLRHLAAPAVALPADGPLTLALNGQVPPLTPEQDGTLTLAVAGLTPTLAVTTTADTATPTAVTCTTDPAQADALAAVPVTGNAVAAAPNATPTADDPPGIIVGYTINGATTLKKLGSAVLLTGKLDTTVTVNGLNGTILADIGIDRAVGTFLSFGFVPVTALTTFTQTQQAKGTFINGVVDVTSDLELSLSGTSVNGTPLDVGPACRTVTAVPVRITGPLNLLGSTNFTTSVTIPRFTGCGTTENLDPLFDGLVSGPGNELDITLTLRCQVVCTDK